VQLAERDPADAALPPTEVTVRTAEHALRALGVARARDVERHFIPGRYQGLDLSRCGWARPVRVEGGNEQWWLHLEVLPLLDEEWVPRTTLLWPFDNLICDRARTERLWGFTYINEMYEPKHKRQFGYYVMPVLSGERLIGRVAPRVDRRQGVLLVEGVFVEAGEAIGEPVREAIASLATFTGALGGVSRGAIAPVHGRPSPGLRPESRLARSSCPRRSGSNREWIATIRPFVTVKAVTETGRPSAVTTTPAAPLTSAGRTRAPGRENSTTARLATATAPRSTSEASGRRAPPSDRSTTSGSSTATSPSRSPARAAAKKASTTSRWAARSASGAGTSAPRTRRRALLANCLAPARGPGRRSAPGPPLGERASEPGRSWVGSCSPGSDGRRSSG
jgi:hypothetical protein